MRNYKSTVTARTLASAITVTSGSGSTAVFLNSSANLPTYPFTLVINPDTVSEEIVTVTGAGGGAGELVVVRGQDGSTAVTHASGVAVRHMITARDLQEPQDHMNASADVHGLATAGPSSASGGSVVGTSASQTLTNKILTTPSITNPTVSTGAFTSPSLTTPTIAGGTVTGNVAATGATLTSPNVSLTAAGVLSLGTRTDAITASSKTVTAAEVGALSGLGTWTSYTPTISGTGWNLGASGSIAGSYVQIGKVVNFKVKVILSGAGATGGTGGLTITAPTGGAAPKDYVVGSCVAVVGGTTRYSGNIFLNGGNLIPTFIDVGSITLPNPDASATTDHPFTWATGSALYISGTYEVA